MGPISETLGLEQGGVCSDSFCKLINNEQEVAHKSELGVTIGDITVSVIGQADDVVLTANNIYSLHNLLNLTLEYCDKYKVQLVADKTKLQVFLPKSLSTFSDYASSSSPLGINSEPI